METGNHPQNIENPLFLFPLFAQDLYVLDTDIQSISSVVNIKNTTELNHTITGNVELKTAEDAPGIPTTKSPKMIVKVVNVFVDSLDNQWTEEATIAYEKLMTNIKIDGENLLLNDFSMLNAMSSEMIHSMINQEELEISTHIISEFETRFCIVWSDRPMKNPPMKHFSMSNFHTYKLLYFPSFSRMLASPELKKSVWISLKQLLGFA